MAHCNLPQQSKFYLDRLERPFLMSQIFMHLIDKIKTEALLPSWLNSELKKLMFERDKLRKVACRLKSGINQVNEATKLAKSFYYNTYFAANQANIKDRGKAYTLLLYTYRDFRAKKHRDKNSLFALEKPADWLYDFFSLVKNDVSML